MTLNNMASHAAYVTGKALVIYYTSHYRRCRLNQVNKVTLVPLHEPIDNIRIQESNINVNL